MLERVERGDGAQAWRGLLTARFQEAPVPERPIGLLWVQMLAAWGARALLAAPADAIWPYRLPSLLGLVMAVLGTYWGARRILAPEAAFLGALLLAATVLILLPGELAMSKAMALGPLTIAMWALVRLHGLPAEEGTQGTGRRDAAILWTTLGLAILLGGPGLLLCPLLTLLALSLWERDASLLQRMRPLWGVPLMLALAAPWAIAAALAGLEAASLTAAASGRSEAVRALHPASLAFWWHVAEPQMMRHAAPPGAFVLTLLVGGLPVTLLLGPLARRLWRARGRQPARALMAWILPYLGLLELLSHRPPLYMLQPVLPALAVAAGWVVGRQTPEAGSRQVNPGDNEQGTDVAPPRLSRWVALPLGVGALALVPALLAVRGRLGLVLDGMTLALALVASVAFALAVLALRHGLAFLFVALATLSALALHPMLTGRLLPAQAALWPADRLAEQVRALRRAGCIASDRPIVVAGFREPSVVFRLGAGTTLTHGHGAANLITTGRHGLAIVEQRMEGEFRARLEALGVAPPPPLARVSALAINRGRAVRFALHAPPSVAPGGACRPRPLRPTRQAP